MSLNVASSAKVNLTLDILGRRADGYHELASVVHTIGLWDELTFERTREPGFRLVCSRPDLAGPDNLCLKAAEAWSRAARDKGAPLREGAAITLNKKIPCGAGLGGGSGNAAATLLALNKLYGAPLDATDLARLGSRLGADMPLFLHGGCMLMEGIGERLTPLAPLRGWLVVAQPPDGLSTARVYEKWDELRLDSEKGTSCLLAVLQGANAANLLGQLANALRNDLMRAALSLGWGAHGLIQKLRDAGALGASMSGSGAAAYGLFENEQAARRAAQALREGAAAAEARTGIWVAPFCRNGVEFADEATVKPGALGHEAATQNIGSTEAS